VAAKLEEASSRHEYRTLFHTLRRLSGKVRSTSDNIKNGDSTFDQSPVKGLQRWQEFFPELDNHETAAPTLVVTLELRQVVCTDDGAPQRTMTLKSQTSYMTLPVMLSHME